ncbi:MAG TPA: VOC family protein [Acidimicrobiales bacterium]|jgi:catechol 2,3-dioxygenase-like lactoylglutathione lyase family enzyme|nr:VOC family protein [Acidimicrobiales bacterium]
MAAVTVNHIGLCVTDLDRSRRFYEEALGFRYERSLQPPDGVCSTLLGVELPVGLTAVYLTHGDFVLELLQFGRTGNPPARERPMTEPGLTHLSLTTADLEATLARVPALGGQVLEETSVGVAVMVRDPDGQLLELLAAREH